MAVVERSDKMYGGTCINIGCIPTKTLVHQAKIASGMKGLTFLEKREFYRNAVSVKDSVTGALRNKNYHNLADNPHVTVYTGFGSFVSSDTVSVRTAAEELLLTAKQIIINTGAETVIPSIDGIADNPFVYTSFHYGTHGSSVSSCDCRRWLYRTGICIHVCFLWLSGDST